MNTGRPDRRTWRFAELEREPNAGRKYREINRERRDRAVLRWEIVISLIAGIVFLILLVAVEFMYGGTVVRPETCEAMLRRAPRFLGWAEFYRSAHWTTQHRLCNATMPMVFVILAYVALHVALVAIAAWKMKEIGVWGLGRHYLFVGGLLAALVTIAAAPYDGDCHLTCIDGGIGWRPRAFLILAPFCITGVFWMLLDYSASFRRSTIAEEDRRYEKWRESRDPSVRTLRRFTRGFW